MVFGKFETKGGAGYKFEGKTIVTDGNHRVNAAIRYKIFFKNDYYIKLMIETGNY